MPNKMIIGLEVIAFVMSLAAVISLLFFIAVFTPPVHAQGVDRTKAVIHHTASPDWDVGRIRAIHVNERGWDDIGYHFLIRADGKVEPGRPLSKQGAHAVGRNHYVGIALTGYDVFTPEQIESLVKLLDVLGVNHIERHHSQCPGPGLPFDAIQRVVEQRRKIENSRLFKHPETNKGTLNTPQEHEVMLSRSLSSCRSSTSTPSSSCRSSRGGTKWTKY